MTRSEFVSGLGFEPDRFQTEAFDALDDGSHVIVAAPTGAGKTLVAAYAVDRAIKSGTRVFYTTPIKALSNQKFHDFVEAYGADNVGLLTGDNAINGEAPVVVMTTEVLRNMLYAGRTLDSLQAVVLDEVHYLQDSYRGPVWEEVIIHLPRTVQLVALSATVSNAPELAEWMSTVRGETALVVETRRPVELENHYLVAERGGPKLHMIRTLIAGKANDKGFRFDPDHRGGARPTGRGKGNSRRKDQRHRPRAKWRTPGRVDIVDELRRNDLLPAIFFIFSRAGCADAAAAVRDSGLVMTSKADRKQIKEIADEHVRGFDKASLDVLDYDAFLAALLAGVAPHHAGMVPPLKETVEACFVRGLTKVVFATETLALGINMPARTVVIDKLTKFTGEHHEALTPAQYTQLTGRAGRRGIDVHGQAVVLWSPWVRFEQVAALAASKEFVLTSAFRPTFNMAANLVRRYDPDRARQMLNLSFAQFRADADVVRSEGALDRLRQRKHQIESRLEAEYGPVEELRAAVETRQELDVDRQDISFALAQMQPGDIVELDGIDEAERPLPTPMTVLSVAYRKGRRIKVALVDSESETYEINAQSLEAVPSVIGAVELPEPYLPHSMSFIHEVSQAMNNARRIGAKRRKGLGPTGAVRSVQDLPPAARKGLKRIDKIDLEIAQTLKAVRSRTESLGVQFERVIELLEVRGHLDGWQLTDSGQRLARLYHECDLLLVEALDDGLFDGLSPSEIAALASTFTYEDRRSGPRPDPWIPTADLAKRFGALTRLHRDLAKAERFAQIGETRAPDSGFMAIAHGWAAGGGLDDVLDGEEITAGDFVRTAKLLIDLLRQIANLAPVPETGRAAAKASDIVFRDLVAASSIVEVDDTDDTDEADDTDESDDTDEGNDTHEGEDADEATGAD